MKKVIDLEQNGDLILPAAFLTGKADFDKWFSRYGGIVLGSAIYVTGTSGGGKTTLMANITTWLGDVVSVIYSREMLKRALKAQLCDLKFTDNCYLADSEDNPTFESFMKEVYELKPKVLIIDSLQVIAKEDYVMTGLMSEDAACYKIIRELRDYASANDAVLFLIGHNTKEGVFAGANTNMQMIDAHIDIVYDKATNSRTMSWGQKNRKGPMGSIPFDIEDSKIVFQSDKKAEDIIKFNAYKETVKLIQEIFNNDSLLRNASDEQKKAFKKQFNELKKSSEKTNKTEMKAISENVYHFLKTAEMLEFNAI